MHTEFMVKNPEGKSSLEDLGAGGNIILKRMLKNRLGRDGLYF
jgi:hypothetical protein